MDNTNLQNQVNDLQRQLDELRILFFKNNFSDHQTFEKSVKVTKDLIVGNTTSKLGFYGATFVAQPSSTGETTGTNGDIGGALQNGSTYNGNNGTTAYTINDIIKHLKNLGLLLK